LFFYEGSSVEVGEEKISAHQAIELFADKQVVIKNGNSESSFLVLQGKPINEPVAQYGPFVMNTQAEIQQAYMEYQQTQFGGWPWPSYDNVHPREKGRFAKYPDGKLEVK
jgi:redox-sensitive bicupin YhaK (pirin superfamily)